MKRANNLLSLIIDQDNLRLAFWKAKKGKSNSKEVDAYQFYMEENLQQLSLELKTGLIDVGQYYHFKIFDPKERNICAAAFKEQVLHHALMNVCHSLFEKKQIFDSYASRKNKGTHAAVNRAALFTKKYTFFLKLDVRKFFDSIHHKVLKNQLDDMIKDPHVLCVFYKIIDSYEASEDRGVPIGNLSSQYFANHYLSTLDHYIKEQLGAKAYVRYMDDMVIWDNDKQFLKSIFLEIKKYVESTLMCCLKPPLFNFSSQGVPFLGYVIKPFDIRLSLRSRRRFVKKIHQLNWFYENKILDEQVCQRRVLPLVAFTKQANSVEFRKKVVSLKQG
jgi:RNA-directed DNA polymerase